MVIFIDYVVVVIGIFLFLVGTYWIVYGKTFEGPVSFRHLLHFHVSPLIVLTWAPIEIRYHHRTSTR